MVGNFVLRRRVISDHITDDIPPQMNILNMVIPIIMHVFHIHSPKASYFTPNVSFVSRVKPLRQPITNDVTNDVVAPTVYRRIYRRKILTLSNQTSRYIHKRIRILVNRLGCLSLPRNNVRRLLLC